jgi:anti-anti-sigma factor
VDPALSFDISYGDDCALARIGGELDIATAPDARAFLLTVLAGGNVSLVVDLADLTFIDATGINVLVRASRRAQENGGWLRLAGASLQLRRILRILHLTALLPAYDTVGEAAGAQPATGVSRLLSH